MIEPRLDQLNRVVLGIKKLFTVSEDAMEPVARYVRNVSPVETWKTRGFYRLFSNNSLFLSDGGWALLPLSPDPFAYFLERFNWVPIILNEDVASEAGYLVAIHKSPRESPADALATVGEVVVCCSRYGSALYYFNERTESAFEFTSEVHRPFVNLS